MGKMIDLRGRAVITRAKEVMTVGNAGSPQHPRDAGPGLAGSGGLGRARQAQFLDDFPVLVALAEWAVENGARLPDEPRSVA